MKKITSQGFCAAHAALLLAAMGLTAMPAGAAEPGAWQEQDMVLDYAGFTTHYSCDGLRDRLRTVLLQLGARPDLSVSTSGCIRHYGGPERFTSVQAHFATLQPTAAAQSGAGAWKSVQLGGINGLDGGECELAEEVVRSVLPHFAVRNVDWHGHCAPHAASAVLSLRVDVFAPPPAGHP